VSGIIRKMKSMIHYKQWDIVLVPFPFTDLSTTKKRPGLIISPNEYNKSNDIIIAFITSNLLSESKYGDFIIKN
jgi:mRNA interferase MazF